MVVFLDAVDSRRSSADERFCNGGHANAGYLLALLADAAVRRLDTAETLEPVAVDAVFLAPVSPGPISVDVQLLRVGRSTSVCLVSLEQSGRTAASCHVVVGRLSPDEPTWSAGAPPELPDHDACTRPPAELAVLAPYLNHVDLRLDPSSAGLLSGRPSGTPEIRGWMHLPETTTPDPLFLIAAPDLFFPTIWQLGSHVAPATVTMSWHGRAQPSADSNGWVWVHVVTTSISESWCDENAICYDSTGRLVATTRQLARLPLQRASGLAANDR